MYDTVVLDVDGTFGDCPHLILRSLRLLAEQQQWDDIDPADLTLENVRKFRIEETGLFGTKDIQARAKQLWNHVQEHWLTELPYGNAVPAVTNWLQIGIPVHFLSHRNNEPQLQHWLLPMFPPDLLDVSHVHTVNAPEQKVEVLLDILKKTEADVLFFDDLYPTLEACIHAVKGKPLQDRLHCYYVLQNWATEYGFTPDTVVGTKQPSLPGLSLLNYALPLWDGSPVSIPGIVSYSIAERFVRYSKYYLPSMGRAVAA